MLSWKDDAVPSDGAPFALLANSDIVASDLLSSKVLLLSLLLSSVSASAPSLFLFFFIAVSRGYSGGESKELVV